VTESVATICDEIAALYDQASLSTQYLPREEDNRDYDCLWVEPWGHDGYFTLRYRERGDVSEIVIGRPDDVVFKALEIATHKKASRLELANRRLAEDSRRQLFELQEGLMAAIKPEWGHRVRAAHAEILLRHPFSDGPP
jgi:hypothetical protein